MSNVSDPQHRADGDAAFTVGRQLASFHSAVRITHLATHQQWPPHRRGSPGCRAALAHGALRRHLGRGHYRATDHGATWQAANTGITLPLHIQGGLAVNPVTPTQVFVGDYYGGGLYRSDNGGLTWTLVLPDVAVRAVVVQPLAGTVVLAGDREAGLNRSADAGQNWSPISATAGLTEPQVRALAFAPAAPDVAYAGAGRTVFRSADAGEQWTAGGTLSSTVQALAVHPALSGTLYAGTSDHSVFRGSTLDHLTMDPIANPQYVNRPFSITLTTRDAMGLPLAGVPSAQLAALQNQDVALAATLATDGYSGIATLADSTGTLCPTTATFVDGIAQIAVAIEIEARDVTITVTVSEGLAFTSAPFDVHWHTRVYVPLVMKMP